jgi:ABC-type transport system substrate-binding protein
VKLPYLDEIKFTNITEGSQRAAAVRKGSVDAAMFAGGSEGTFIKDLRLRKSLVTEFKSPNEYYPSLWMNQNTTADPTTPFANLNARLAVASCIDRVNYNKVRLKGEGVVADSIVGPNSIMYNKTGFIPFNVAKAKAYVAAYKADTGKSDLTFTSPADVSSVSQANAKFLQSTFATCGITMNIVVEESAIIIAKAFNGKTGQNAYDAIAILLCEGTDVGFNAPFLLTNSFPADSTNPAAYFRTGLGTILSLSHHSDTAVDDLLYQGRAATTKAAAKLAFAAATKEIQSQAIITAITWNYYTFFTNNKANLKGIGQLQIEKGKTQRLVTNWGIDWTGVSKG